MATYVYSVRDKAGKVVKGKLEGESKDAVQSRLAQMGYIILELDQQGGLAVAQQRSSSTVKVKPKEVTIFARQFATMISAGLSLTKCLSILVRADGERGTARCHRQIGKDVEAGQSLSDALGKHPKVFPRIFVNMVRAGETGGVLDEVLARLADHLEQEQAAQGQDQVGDDLPDRDGRAGARRPGRDDGLRRADVREDVRRHGRRAAAHDAAARRRSPTSSPACGAS